jgi:hypothetical protein
VVGVVISNPIQLNPILFPKYAMQAQITHE